MAINAISAIKAQHHTTIDDPYGFGIHIRIRRAGHKKAVAAQQADTGAQLALARELIAAQKRIREAGLEVPTAPGDIALVDEKFGAYLVKTQQVDKDEIEERAAAYVAGWGGEVFGEDHLPVDGAFSLADVRSKFFAVFGDYDEDDIPVLPRYMDAESGEFISDEERMEHVAGLREEYAENLATLLAEPSREDFDDAAAYLQAKVDWLSEEEKAKREKSADTLAEDFTTALLAAGIKETPFGGRPVREAMALVIIDAAVDLESTYRNDTGFLSPSSPRSRGSKASRRKPTRTSKRGRARKRG